MHTTSFFRGANRTIYNCGQKYKYGVVVTDPAVVPAGTGSSSDELWCVIDSSHCYLQPRQLHGMRCAIQTSSLILFILLKVAFPFLFGVKDGGGRGSVINNYLILQIPSVNSAVCMLKWLR